MRTVGDLKAQAYEHFTVTSSGAGQLQVEAGAPPGRSSAGPSVLPAAELCLWVNGRPLQDAELVRDLTVRLAPVTSGATEVPATGSSGAIAAEVAAAAAAATVTLHLARKPGKPCGLFARVSISLVLADIWVSFLLLNVLRAAPWASCCHHPFLLTVPTLSVPLLPYRFTACRQALTALPPQVVAQRSIWLAWSSTAKPFIVTPP